MSIRSATLIGTFVVLGLCAASVMAARPTQQSEGSHDLRAVASLAGQTVGDSVTLLDQASATLDALLVDLATEPRGRELLADVIAVRQHFDASSRTLNQLHWALLECPLMKCEYDRSIAELQVVLLLPPDSWVPVLRQHLEAGDGLRGYSAVLDQQVEVVRRRLTSIESALSSVRAAVAKAEPRTGR
jgi:hypothetical protein